MEELEVYIRKFSWENMIHTAPFLVKNRQNIAESGYLGGFYSIEMIKILL